MAEPTENLKYYFIILLCVICLGLFIWNILLIQAGNKYKMDFEQCNSSIDFIGYKNKLADNENSTIGNIAYNVNENCKIFSLRYNITTYYFDDYQLNRSSIVFGCLVNSTDKMKMIPESVMTIKRQN